MKLKLIGSHDAPFQESFTFVASFSLYQDVVVSSEEGADISHPTAPTALPWLREILRDTSNGLLVSGRVRRKSSVSDSYP